MKLNKNYSTIFLILAAVFLIIFLISKAVFTLILAIIFLLIALYIMSQLKKAAAAQSGPEPTRQAPAAEDISPAEIPSAEIQISSEAVLKRDLSDMPEIVYSAVTKETTDDDIFPFVVIDAETTGLDPQEDEITEITAIKFDKGYVPVLSFSALLEAEKKLPEGASKDKPLFGEVARSFSDFVSGCNFVGHNLPFDVKFLYCNGTDLSPTAKYYNTLPIARKVLNAPSDVENHKLVTLCKYFGIDFSGAQGASDCLATGKVFEKLVETIKQS